MECRKRVICQVYLVLLLIFVITFIIGVAMANYTPYSGRAYLERGMAPVYSKVSGVIERVHRKNGEAVRAGEVLFELDGRNFRAEVLRLEAQYEQAQEQLAALDFQIREEEAKRNQAERRLEKCARDYERDRTLTEKHVVAIKVCEESRLQYDLAEQELTAIRAGIESLKRRRGNPNQENSELKRLRAELDIARNNLDDTRIKAPVNGIFSCHQLYAGQAVETNRKYAVIHTPDDLTVNVDLMEKSAGAVQAGQPVLIAFDAIPGKLFAGHVAGQVRELESGYTAPDQFNRIEEDTRWIRSVGRSRVLVSLDREEGLTLATGAKAAASFLNAEHPVLSRLSTLWIRSIGMVNYVY